MIAKIKNNWSYLCVAIYIGIVFSFVGMYGENIILQVHDFLDGSLIYEKVLTDYKLLFDNDGIVPMLGGVSRHYMGSEFNVKTWIFVLFPTFYAIIIHYVFSIVVAVFGSVLLGKSILGESWLEYKHIVIACGFMLGILPVYPTGQLWFVSLPLLFTWLFRLYRSGEKKYYLFIFLYPVLSSFIFFGVFICGFILIFIIFAWMAKRKAPCRLIGGLACFIGGSVIVDYHTLYIMLFSSTESIRSSFAETMLPFGEVCREIYTVFVNGQYHSGTVQKYIVLPVCFLYFLYLNISYIKKKRIRDIFKDPYNWLCCWCLFNSVVYGLNYYWRFKLVIQKLFPMLKGFSFARTLWFGPFVWYFMFAVVLCRIASKGWDKRAVYVICVFAIVAICCSKEVYNPIRANLSMVARDVLDIEQHEMTYTEFYSESLFDEIKKDIDYQDEWCIAYGMHPAVLEYNGVATLDGYLSMYSQDYKEQFRELITPYEEHGGDLEYFDIWGARAYIFGDIEYLPVKDLGVDTADMWIDTEEFKKMNGKYIFSRVKILNAEELSIELIGEYSNNMSPYMIYVYCI